MVDEAPLRMSKNGLVADVRGWFVVNARESRWRDAGPLGVFCTFEGKKPFLQLGINISVLEPGQQLGRYHREANAQEGFLLLSGTCVLIVEGEERTLRAWDYFHCPPGTEHVLVAKETAVLVAVGARGRGKRGVVYPVSKAAARHGASVEHETTRAAEAYAGLPRWQWAPYEEGWLPEQV